MFDPRESQSRGVGFPQAKSPVRTEKSIRLMWEMRAFPAHRPTDRLDRVDRLNFHGLAAGIEATRHYLARIRTMVASSAKRGLPWNPITS